VADRGPSRTSTRAFLTTVADEIIIPSYRASISNLAALDGSLATLCAAPSGATLGAAQAGWRDADLAFQSSRAGSVGPAVERRLMSAIGFRANPAEIEALLAGSAPLDRTALAGAGAGVRGIFAAEVVLFGPRAAALARGDDRACQYLRSNVGLSRDAVQQVLDDWTGPDPYRRTFIDGMDGDQQSSVSAIVNELTARLTQIDIQGLRAYTAARSYEDLPSTRQEGPAAHGVAALRGILGGTAAIVEGPIDGPGLADLVRGHSGGTATRLEHLARAAVTRTGRLPDSIAAVFAVPDALMAAQRAVADLRVMVSTEVASQLGVTIGFSDADGDS
jgi:predicted lipoprotein